MDAIKRRLSADRGVVEHHEYDEKAEHGGQHPRDYVGDATVMNHREDDDRAEEAKGRNADQIDGKYWLSVNYIGTMFAIGMAFMGGIGGKNVASRSARTI